jgi:hypothetical protein
MREGLLRFTGGFFVLALRRRAADIRPPWLRPTGRRAFAFAALRAEGLPMHLRVLAL